MEINLHKTGLVTLPHNIPLAKLIQCSIVHRCHWGRGLGVCVGVGIFEVGSSTGHSDPLSCAHGGGAALGFPTAQSLLQTVRNGGAPLALSSAVSKGAFHEPVDSPWVTVGDRG